MLLISIKSTILANSQNYNKRLYLEAFHINKNQNSNFNGNIEKRQINQVWNPVINATTVKPKTIEFSKKQRKTGNTGRSLPGLPVKPTNQPPPNQQQPTGHVPTASESARHSQASHNYSLRSRERVNYNVF